MTASPSTNNTPLPYVLLLNFSPTVQGKKVRLRSFAYDGGGRLGYSVRATGVAQTGLVPAIDTALVVYGRTYSLPVNRNGGSPISRSTRRVATSSSRTSTTAASRSGRRRTQSFDPTGFVVGSQPWGMTMSRTAAAGDTLYVANSGGTNLSRVYIGAATASGMREDLANRLLTRVSFMFKLTEVRDVRPARFASRSRRRSATRIARSTSSRAARADCILHQAHHRGTSRHGALHGSVDARA